MHCCRKKQGLEARVVGHALVVSFSGDTHPRVWRRDLGDTTSSVTEIRDEGGKSLLVMSDNKTGTTETIGVFADKASAQAALQTVTAALLQGDVTPHGFHATGRTCHGHGLLGRLIRLSLWLAALVVAVLIMLFVFFPIDGRMVNNTAIKAPPPAVKTGVPVPADELFGK